MEREPLPAPKATSVFHMIGRDLSWLERQVFRLLVGGWRQPLYWLHVLVVIMILIPPYVLTDLAEWLRERVLDPLRELIGVRWSPYERTAAEWEHGFWHSRRVTRALRWMGLTTQEEIDAHQSRPE